MLLGMPRRGHTKSHKWRHMPANVRGGNMGSLLPDKPVFLCMLQGVTFLMCIPHFDLKISLELSPLFRSERKWGGKKKKQLPTFLWSNGYGISWSGMITFIIASWHAALQQNWLNYWFSYDFMIRFCRIDRKYCMLWEVRSLFSALISSGFSLN